MLFTLHATRRTPHGASRLVQAKIRRAPSRHSRDARVYGHTTTAMHKLSAHTPRYAPSCLSRYNTLLPRRLAPNFTYARQALFCSRFSLVQYFWTLLYAYTVAMVTGSFCFFSKLRLSLGPCRVHQRWRVVSGSVWCSRAAAIICGLHLIPGPKQQ